MRQKVCEKDQPPVGLEPRTHTPDFCGPSCLPLSRGPLATNSLHRLILTAIMLTLKAETLLEVSYV